MHYVVTWRALHRSNNSSCF